MARETLLDSEGTDPVPSDDGTELGDSCLAC